MESKVCVPKRNHSDDDDDRRNSKQRRRRSSDRHLTRDRSNKGGSRKYEDLKVGDPYYSGGIGVDHRKDEDNYKDESKRRKRRGSKDRYDKENRSVDFDNEKEEKIGAPYYSGGIAAADRESGENTSSDEDDKVGQRYYSTETADGQRKNSESYWNKYAKKDKANVCI